MRNRKLSFLIIISTPHESIMKGGSPHVAYQADIKNLVAAEGILVKAIKVRAQNKPRTQGKHKGGNRNIPQACSGHILENGNF